MGSQSRQSRNRNAARLRETAALCATFSLLSCCMATTTIDIPPNATQYTLSHCGPTCTVDYTVVELEWASTTTTFTAYGVESDLANTIDSYWQYFNYFAPQSVLGSVISGGYEVPEFTATCCDDAWYISSGVTAIFETNLASATTDASTCQETEALFTGSLVGTSQASPPTDVPFLQHDCGLSTTVTKTILTQVTVVAATPNPPTATGNGQSTWWEDGSDTVTIELDLIPSTFTISPCPFTATVSCSYELPTMDLVWEQTTITISANATDLPALELEIASSIATDGDWVNGTGGAWDPGFVTETCCEPSVYVVDEATIDYEGWCPTTILTGYTTVLPQSIAYYFVDGDLADCNINVGGDANIDHHAGPPNFKGKRFGQESDDQRQNDDASYHPKGHHDTSKTAYQLSVTSEPLADDAAESATPGSGATSAVDLPVESPSPNSPEAPQIAPIPLEPSPFTILSSSPILITTTDASGSPTVISTFTEVPIGTAVNVLTTDAEGNLETTRLTVANPSATGVGSNGEETNSQSDQSSSEATESARTTIYTVTMRQGSGFVVETQTSTIPGDLSSNGAETTSPAEGETGVPSANESGLPSATGSDAISQIDFSLHTLLIVMSTTVAMMLL
ncbi:hypothetical protein ABW21_db0209203 [Orbilia brochopaga]|nr:hypothetical protein ABW21_db0209203 [Drechslerella brochopaga]